jgi:hypothetical protein
MSILNFANLADEEISAIAEELRDQENLQDIMSNAQLESEEYDVTISGHGYLPYAGCSRYAGCD